jgi:hypothetical protein
MRFVLSILVILALCGCKSETKVEKAPAPAPAPEEKPIITEETKAEDANVKAEVESICSALKKCQADEACDSKAALKALALKSPYATGLRERLVSTDLAKKTLDELTLNAQGLGAKCELEK